MADLICLLVDDDESIRHYLKKALECEGLKILEAEDAAQALRIVNKLGGRLDLIVSDIRMPGDMNGIDLAYTISNSFPAVPVILISGFADEESAKHAGGSFTFIQKPFGPETILSAARRAMAAKSETGKPKLNKMTG